MDRRGRGEVGALENFGSGYDGHGARTDGGSKIGENMAAITTMSREELDELSKTDILESEKKNGSRGSRCTYLIVLVI